MTKKEIVARLGKIKEGIEIDNFTIENINRLIKDINSNIHENNRDDKAPYTCLICGKDTPEPACAECDDFVTNLV